MSRVLFAYVAILCAAASFGVFLNDEQDQAAAFWSLAHGSLHVRGIPEGTYVEGDNIVQLPRIEHVPIASTPLNLLALPVLAAVLTLEALAPIQFWFAGVYIWALWRAFALPPPWRVSGPTAAIRWLTLGLLAVAVTGGFRTQGPDVHHYQAIIALQVTNMLLSVVGAALLWHLISRRVAGPGRAVVFFGTVLGSWLFWAEGAKYHMLTAVVVLAILALLERPLTLARSLALGALAGLSVWVNIGVGAAVLMAFVLAELVSLPRRFRQWRSVLGHWAALGSGALCAMLPMFVENQVLYGNPFLNFYFGQAPRTESGLVDSAAEGLGSGWDVLTGMLSGTPLPLTLQRLASILTTGHLVEARPMGLFMLTPILAAAVVGAWQVLRQRPRSPTETWALSLVVTQALLLTNRGVGQGAGFDVRLWFHVIPALALLAIVGARGWLNGLQADVVRRGATTALVFLVLAYGALYGLTANGYKIAFAEQNHAWTFLQGAWVLAALAALAGLALQVLGWRRSLQPANTAAVAFVLAAPLLWSSLLLVAVHTSLPDSAGHAGGGMVLPGMDAVSTALHEVVFPPSPQPITYDQDGNLFFHPDFGRCDVPPYPCPPELMLAPWANSTTPSP